MAYCALKLLSYAFALELMLQSGLVESRSDLCTLCNRDRCYHPGGFSCRLKAVPCASPPCLPVRSCVQTRNLPRRNPCDCGHPVVGTDNKELNCGRGGVLCPPGTECKTHPTDQYAVCCAMSLNDICYLPLDHGELGSNPTYHQRFYFDPTTAACEIFMYSGLGGNANNFRTQNECEVACGDICNLPPETGLCRAAFRRYYYNPNEGGCQIFTYGGCGGNQNNFKTKAECEKKCIGHSAICPLYCGYHCSDGFVRDNNNCQFCKCRQIDSVSCGPRPVCAIACPHGNVLDKRGCPTCRCRADHAYCENVCFWPCRLVHYRGDKCPVCVCKQRPRQ